MSQEEYRSCMAKKMGSGRLKGLSKENRRIEFCSIAKECSKGLPYEEAKRICSQPKPPKEPKVKAAKKGQSCEKSAHKVAECVVSRLVENDVYRDQALNINSVGSAVTNALIECSCGNKNE